MWGFSGNRRWVYARGIEGRFQRYHRVSGLLLQAMLFVTPWLSVHGQPAVRIDLPGRRLFLLGWVFSSNETFNLVLLALIAAFSLFFFTSLLGRLWCGYTCPQTVFLEEWIRPIEKAIEGDRAVRMRRDQGPWTFDRAWRKAAKFSLFAILAVWVSATVLSYFAGAQAVFTGRAGPVDYAMIGIFSVGMFLDWAWFREQLCNYLCPYARFQGALTDDHSLTISYDAPRGEPRGKGKKSAQEGHCIDCNKCVDVCPAGIDIRDGFQLECIACARCIDACETVMPKLGFPTLVRYSTVAVDRGGKTRLLRPRTGVYGALLAALGALLVGRLLLHEPLEVLVNRQPGSLFVVDDDGAIRNVYMVHVTNRDAVDKHLYVVSIHGLDHAQLAAAPIELGALESKVIPVQVRMPAGMVNREADFTLRVTQVGDKPHEVEQKATFRAPARDREG
ncbi:MAG: cytochrome c oxidase accessory protein CcoG [Myxococcota bacterium]